jgi:hypothetical protein
MSDAPEGSEVPEGAAVFPLIPAELGVNPLLLAVLHGTVFLAGSSDELVNPDAAGEALEYMAEYLQVNPDAAGEALEYMAEYLQRLEGPALDRVREDMVTLVSFARQENWPRQLVQALKTFLDDYGIGKGEA